MSDREYYESALERRQREIDPDFFRKQFMQEPIFEPMPERYWFFAPSFRVAERVLMVDHDIFPKLPCIRIVTERADRLRGLRDAVVTLIDPRLEFQPHVEAEFRLMETRLGWRTWNRRDKEYLRGVSRGR